MAGKIVTVAASDTIFINYLIEAFDKLALNLKVIVQNSDYKHIVPNYTILNDGMALKSKFVDSKVCLLNMDSIAAKEVSSSGTIVTYGIGMKNTITISSLEENNFVYCVQKYLYKNSFTDIEPQEIPIRTELFNEMHLYALLNAVTIGLLEGINGKDIEKKLSKKYLSI